MIRANEHKLLQGDSLPFQLHVIRFMAGLYSHAQIRIVKKDLLIIYSKILRCPL